MTIQTDKVNVENGADYTFVCHKIPFAISCSSELPHGDCNLIDLDLVIKMKIPLRNIKVTRMSILGHDVRAVGRIKQTVQCVHRGRVQGTVHLEGKVVRDLYSTFNVDCVASSKTYERLVGKKPPDPDDGYESIEENEIVPNLDDPIEGEAKDEKEEDEENQEEVPPDREHDHHQQDPIQESDPPDVDVGELPWDPRYAGVLRSLLDNGTSDNKEENNETETVYNEEGYDMTPTKEQSTLEFLEQENIVFCKMCYMEGEPDHVTFDHWIFDPACPSLSDVDKRRLGISRPRK